MQQKSNSLQDLAVALISYKNKPVAFVENILGATPDPWQREALRAVASGKSIAIRSGHGTGKSCLLAWIILWFLVTRPHPVIPCTAPTQHQLSDVLWAEVRRWIDRSKLKGIVTWTATRIGLVGSEETWFAAARSSNTPENLAGFHAQHLLYVVDEASGIDDEIMEVVHGATSTAGAIVVLAGNPTRRSGHFFKAFHEDREHWHTIHISSEDSPRVSPEYAAGMAARYGKDSDIYRVRVEGNFPLSESDGFIAYDLAVSATAGYEDAEAGYLVELGVDVARFGSDDSVVCVRAGDKVITFHRYHGLATNETAAKVIELAREYRPTSVKVDDSGIGGAVTDLLSASDELWDMECGVVAVNFGGRGSEHYQNTSALMWGNIKDKLSDGTLAIPDDPDLINQLSNRKYGLTPAGKIALERKEDMRKRGLPSPDLADSLALAFHEPTSAAIDIFYLDL